MVNFLQYLYNEMIKKNLNKKLIFKKQLQLYSRELISCQSRIQIRTCDDDFYRM